MDRITPLDLERAELSRQFRGYNRAQVQALLQRAAVEMSSLRSELDAAKAESAKLSQELSIYRTQEDTLKEALLLAQRTADETRALAHREANAIVEAARRSAEDVETEMQGKINDLRWELERMRLDKQRFLAKYRTLLEGQLREIAETGSFAAVETELNEDAVEA